jgi:hypothetical protein
MGRLKILFDANWTPEKCRRVSSQLRRDLAMYGGVSHVSDIMAEDEKAPEGPKKIKLYCNSNQFGRGRCTAEWESDTFTECPNGHGRKWVHKGERPVDEVA